MLKKNTVLLTALILALFSFSYGQPDPEKGIISLPKDLTLLPHGYAHMEAGQIAKGSLNELFKSINMDEYKIDHVWTEDAYVWLGFDAIYKERLKMVFDLAAKLYFSYPQFFTKARYTKNLRQDVGLEELYTQYHFGDAEMPWLLARVGYFKYKYNPEARNLGEYLFRSGTYPVFLDMGFDFPMTKLLGFQVESNLFKSLKLDLLFTSATVYPAMNWSLSLLGSYNVAKMNFINIGLGVDFAHLFDVYTDHSFLVDGGDPTSLESDLKNGQYIESITKINDTTYDTTWKYYTAQGTKVMARLSINPKVFIPWKEIRENDLKLYAEACLVGVKSYPDSGKFSGTWDLYAPSYNDPLQKIPVVVGMNMWTHPVISYGIAPEMLLWAVDQKYNLVPQLSVTAAGLLVGAACTWLEHKFDLNLRPDILNIEVELFNAKYNNDASNLINYGSRPMPYLSNDPNAPKRNPYKWSVYAKRSFFNGHLAVTGQIGRDHMRLPCASYDDEMWNELLVEDKDWWWVLKTSWMF